MDYSAGFGGLSEMLAFRNSVNCSLMLDIIPKFQVRRVGGMAKLGGRRTSNFFVTLTLTSPFFFVQEVPLFAASPVSPCPPAVIVRVLVLLLWYFSPEIR